jgi:hypothetical protein
MLYDRLGKHAKTTQKIPHKLSSISVQENQSYGLYKIHTVQTVHSIVLSLDFRASFLLYEPKNPYSTTSFLNCTLPRFLCQLLMLYDLLNPYSTTCNKCCTFCLEMHASFQPWNACPSSAKMASFSNSNFFSCSLKKCFNYPRMGAPSYPNRPHEGISRVISSNG